MTSIGDYAFYGCKGLTSIVIPEGVISIGSGTFAGCSSLSEIEIGADMVYIGKEAFYNCGVLKSVRFGGTIAQWNAIVKGNNWKDDVPADCVVHCTDGDINI